MSSCRPVGYTCGNTGTQTEPVAGQADHQHGQQSNGAAGRKMEQFDIGKNGSQGNGHGTECQLLYRKLAAIHLMITIGNSGSYSSLFHLHTGKQDGKCQQSDQNNDQQNISQCGGVIESFPPVSVNSSVQHKKILLRVREEGQHRIHTDRISV